MNAAPPNRAPTAPPSLDEDARTTNEEILQRLGSSSAGLTEDEAASRLAQYGPNEVAQERKHEWAHRL